MDIASVLRDQKVIATAIDEEITKFQKEKDDPSKQMTRSVYFNKKLIVGDLYLKFQNNHRALVENLAKEHEYFVKKRYDGVKKIYDEYMEVLTAPDKDPLLYDQDPMKKKDINEKPPPIPPEDKYIR